MTDTESMLLRAVLESPGDDLPRLAYADWLDDNRQPLRAATIRAQLAGEVAAVPMTSRYDLEEVFGIQPHRWESMADRDAARLLSGDVMLTFRRGFVATVRAPLAVLVGGECNECYSHPSWGDFTSPNLDCPACDGTGRVQGIGRELFERQPVTRVDTDRLPSTHLINGRIRWAFWKEHEPGYESLPNIMPESCVPWQLLEYLDTGYESESAARSALSDALVAHFREQCGLTPLV